MRNVSDKPYKESQNTYFIYNNFFPEILAFMSGKMWYSLTCHRLQYKTGRIRFACWITNATETHSEYVTLIVFLRQQLLHEGYLILRYTYIVL
jgi:hypothetical protein